MKHIRQGDLIFTLVDHSPEITRKQNRLTVAEGEFTGHHHVLVTEGVSEIIGDKTHFTLTGKAKLVHPEHGNTSSY